MGFLADSIDDPRYAANMALAAGLLGGNPSQGLLGYSSAMTGAKKAALEQSLLNAQVENYKSEVEARKLKLIQDQRQQDFLTGTDSTSTGGVWTPGGASTNPQPSAGGLLGQARAFGIPDMAIRADMALNGGKGISDMLFKRGAPDMQVSNGYAYNKNNLGAGYLPQLNTSQDGKTSMVQIGPNGLPVVSAPQGAYDTFAGYQNVQEGTKANYDPVTVTPQGQSPQMTSRGALMRNPQTQGRPMVSAQQQAAADRDRAAILQSELSKAQDQLKVALSANDGAAANRARNDLAALQAEIGRDRATVGLPLESEAEKAYKTDIAKNQAEGEAGVLKANQGAQSAIYTANRVIGAVDRALDGVGYTTSGVGSILSGVPGTSAKDLQSSLQTIKANLGFQELQAMRDASPTGGALGQVAVQELQSLQAAIASLDQSQSPAQLKANLEGVKNHLQNWRSVYEKSAQRAGGNSSSAAVLNTGAAPNESTKAPPTVPVGAKAGQLTKGQKYTLPNGETATWDGMRFKGD